MSRHLGWALMAACALAGLACSGWTAVDLAPYPNPFGPDDPLWAEQPHRDNPLEVVASADGATAWVSLQGSPDEPGRHVVEVDAASGEVRRRIEVGSGPTGLALHPAGRVLVVFNRFSNYASVIDTQTGRVSGRIPSDFYAIEGAWTPDGRALWISNRWRDAVAVWDVEVTGGRLEVVSRLEPGVPVGTNPRDLAMSLSGDTVAVASLTATTLSLLDVSTRTERARIDVGAPVNDVVISGDLVIVATLSASTHHQPHAGPDTDGDGVPGDGTPNINFQDLQNELAVYDLDTGAPLARYTSDSICCRDYRDVHPDDLDRLGDLLPPADTWVVGGALPEQLALDGDTLWVSYSGSDEVQSFVLGPGGGLSPGPVHRTVGHNPHGITVAGDKLLVAHRLSETLGIYDLDGAVVHEVVVGDLDGGAFPATDAEIGELFNFVTAGFSVDGDQTCQHCHREGGNIDKAFSMPLTSALGLGLRQTMAYRGAADTRPWFFESAMDESNFVPVINEFARIENFCCSDYTLWPAGAPAGCGSAPPVECVTEPNPSSPDGGRAERDGSPFAAPRPTTSPTRDAFYTGAMRDLIARELSFGDGLYWEDPISGERSPIPLDFDGITRALGLFLLQEPGLLPNPNDADRATVRRGEALFESPQTGCASCHPAPAYALSTDVGVLGAPLVMGPVVTPLRDENGDNLDLLSGGFLAAFPRAGMDRCEDVCSTEACEEDPRGCDHLREVDLGVPSLRGIWDRAPGMLHHGSARGLVEVLASPGHPALGPGEVGRNERDGMPDTHGGTSHLDRDEVQALIDFIETL